MKVAWLGSALESLRRHHGRIARDNPAAARRVLLAIRSSTTRLQEFPASGRTGKVVGTREVVVPGLPYLVVYRVRDDRVEILRVFHDAQDWSLDHD